MSIKNVTRINQNIVRQLPNKKSPFRPFRKKTPKSIRKDSAAERLPPLAQPSRNNLPTPPSAFGVFPARRPGDRPAPWSPQQGGPARPQRPPSGSSSAPR